MDSKGIQKQGANSITCSSKIEQIQFQSCNDCYKRKRKCDRTYPTCKPCAIRKKECSYQRKSGRKKNSVRETITHNILLRLPKSTSVCDNLKTFREVELDQNGNSKQQNSIDFKVEKWGLMDKFKTRVTFIESQKSNDKHIRKKDSTMISFHSLNKWNESVKLINFNSPRGGWISFLQVLFNFPLYQDKKTPGLESFLSLSKKAQLPDISKADYSSLATLPYFFKSTFYQVIEKHQCIILKAEKIYFDCVNRFLPLFLESSFKRQERSIFLLSALWACGIHLLPTEEQDQILLKYLHYQVYIGLRSTYTHPSLDSLQAILITIHGLQHYNWGTSPIKFNYGMMLEISHCLGLHQKKYPKKLNIKIKIERRMAYNRIIYFEALSALGMNVPCTFYSVIYYFKKKELQFHPNILFSHTNLHPKDVNSFFGNICSLLISSTLLHLSRVMSYICFTRNNVLNGSLNSSELIESISWLLIEIRKVQVNFQHNLITNLGPYLPKPGLLPIDREPLWRPIFAVLGYVSLHSLCAFLKTIQLVFYIDFEIPLPNPSLMPVITIPFKTSYSCCRENTDITVDELKSNVYKLSSSFMYHNKALLKYPNAKIHNKYVDLGLNICKEIFNIEEQIFNTNKYFASRCPVLTICLFFLIDQYSNFNQDYKADLINQIKRGKELLFSTNNLCFAFTVDSSLCILLINSILSEKKFIK
ncbi:hypothetical protein K502DRAFT_364207 [Neoconidiobolus thromboides FSU 785]|nr:hypothetical protein K502DRAFT_364207 [Neoconidiobolus thromboides FSU 785]